MLGIYIHIPFCSRICSYCDFSKIYYNEKIVDKYLEELEKEIKERYQGEIIDTIYIGGGTPSSLNYQELRRLFKIIEIFNLKDKYEFTIECNIENINQEKLELFYQNGVNRLSIGIESFDDNIIKILNRHHDKEMAFKNIKLCKKYFDNINIDLIYGVNNDIEIVKKDIDYFLELDISHISCYSLIIEENTKLYIDGHKYIDEDKDFEMFKYIDNKLVLNGYKHYEVSNYAKDNKISIHNYNYWLNGSYYGFGLGAVSYIDNFRISNTKNISKYLDSNYIKESIFEDERVRRENDLILGLRLLEGININNYNKKYNTNLLDKDIIKKLVKERKLEIYKDNIRCNKEYIYLLNNILVEIIGSDL